MSKVGEINRLTKMIKRLGGNEDLVFTLVHNICKNLKSFKTGNISSNDFDEHLGITRNSRETALKRLCKKKKKKRYKGISGSRGMINIGLSEKTFEKSMLIGNVIPVDYFPGWISTALLFWSFVLATFVPMTIVLLFNKKDKTYKYKKVNKVIKYIR